MKGFLCVCVGLIGLIVSVVTCFTSAKAQGSDPVYFAGVGGASAEVIGRTVYYLTDSTPTPTAFPDPLPGSADIASVLVHNAGFAVPATTVVLSNGDVYHRSGIVDAWTFVGTFGGATAVRPASLGTLKARYR